MRNDARFKDLLRQVGFRLIGWTEPYLTQLKNSRSQLLPFGGCGQQ
jgi:hypothetical protein